MKVELSEDEIETLLGLLGPVTDLEENMRPSAAYTVYVRELYNKLLATK